MSRSTLEAAPSQPSPPQTDPQHATPEVWTLRLFMRRHPWWSVGVLTTLLSIVLVLWAGTRPGFDPYGWLVWGHQTLTGSLDTNAAPSWKPLPYLFTVLYALTGHYELRLWMITAAAVSLSGVVFAARIAYRLTDAPSQRRWAAIGGGVFAGLALLGIQHYAHYILSSQSDPMIVALCLGAIDCQLHGRPRAAFVLGVLAGLGRPEVWAFLGLYSIWAWRALPETRKLLVGGWVVIALLWFGIPALTSRTPFVSASNALDSGRRLTNNQVFGTIGRFLGINELPVALAALLAVVLALLRRDRHRDRVTLALAGGIVLWVVVEIAFALHGWPGLSRYMFEAGGALVVLAGVGVGRLLAAHPRWPGIPSWAGTWAGPVVAVALVASLAPAAISHARVERKDLHEQRLRTAEITALTPVVHRLGGAARIRGCGEPLTRLEYQTMLAYTLRVNVSRVGFKYGQAIAHGNPIVLFTPYPTKTGWVVQAVHQVSPACRSLPHGP
ncbi:MAG: hypothetical protein ACR2MK_00465 [Solirubrobacteraceae bacterium]